MLKNVYFNNAGWANFVKKVGQVIGLPIKATTDTISKFFNRTDETEKYGLEGKHLEDRKEAYEKLLGVSTLGNKRIGDTINYLKNTNITEYPNSISLLFKEFELFKNEWYCF